MSNNLQGINQNAPGGDTPPNPFANPPELPAVPVVPGFDVAAGKTSIVTLHNLLILVVLVISAGAIFGLRKIGLSGAKSNAALTAADLESPGQRIDPLANRILMEDLSASRTGNQVQAEELKKNPFSAAQWLAPEPTPEQPNKAPVVTGKTPAEIERELDAAAMDELKTLNVQSVVAGSRPVARINGQLYRVGDPLGKTCKVVWIEGRSVDVESNGKTYTLTMGN